MPRSRSLAFASVLERSADQVWSTVASMRGVNAELGPWLRMTAPADAGDRWIDQAPIGEALFSSWVLALGIVPIDRHHFRLARVDVGRAFDEDSTSWTERRWRHHRDVEPRGPSACVLTDRLDFEPRLRAAGPLLEGVIRATFEHRHRVLRARFGGVAAPSIVGR